MAAKVVNVPAKTDFGDLDLTNVGSVALDEITSDSDTSVTVTLGADAGDDFIVATNALVVEGDGTKKVGIGTATPSTQLDVVGGITATSGNDGTGTIAVRSGDASQYSKISMGTNANKATIGCPGASDTFFTDTAAGDLVLRADDNNNKVHIGAGASGAAQLVVTEHSGTDPRVGIGTASPDRALEILDASNPQLRLTHTDNTEYLDVQSLSTGNAVMTMTDGTMHLRSGGAYSYLQIQNTTTGQSDGTGDGFTIGANGVAGYLLMRDASSTLSLGVGGVVGISLDASRNATFVNGLSANGSVTLGDAGTDAHTLNGTLSFDSTPADETCSGITATFTAGEALVRGDCVYFKASDSKMWKAIATATATARCVAVAAANIAQDDPGLFLLQGFVQDNGSFPTWTVGGAIYTPEASGGVPTQTAPSTDGDFVQVIGWATGVNTIYFNPDTTVIEVA